jgi:hypothetical protein
LNKTDPDERPNPMNHPDEQPSGGDGTPKFGRLLIVLVLVVVFIGFLTWASEAWFSH